MFGINILSVFRLPPLDFVALAAELGCPTISMALEPFSINPENYASWSLRSDPEPRRALRSALADHGVKIDLGEGLLLLPDTDVRTAFGRDVALMAELGVPRVSLVSFDPDQTRTFDRYAETAELVAAAGLSTVLEYAPCFPTTPDLASAVAAKKHVARSDFQILVDTMHHARSGGTAADLAALPTETVGYVQLCDVPRVPAMADYMEEAMRERRPPGEGDLPMPDFVAALPQDVPFSLEIPLATEAEAGNPPAVRMRRAVTATRALMENAARRPASTPH